MFSSKLTSYKFQTNSNNVAETKLQKYLRAKKEKILEKCFNIKTENNVINEPSNKTEEIIKQTFPGQQNVKELWQPNKNISKTTINNKEIHLKPIISKTSINKTNSLREQTTKFKTMDVTKSTSSREISQNKKRPSTGDYKKCNNSSSKYNSKSFGYLQTSRPSSATNWKSPFSSFTTTGAHSRSLRKQQTSEFAYDLSREELKFNGKFCGPMKPPSEAERQLLVNGPRKHYLNQRYEYSPAMKYNYPEATSWRIGWLQQQMKN